MKAWRKQSGFTLLELLIGLALLGLILALMFGGLRLGIKSWDSGALASEEMARIRVFEGQGVPPEASAYGRCGALLLGNREQRQQQAEGTRRLSGTGDALRTPRHGGTAGRGHSP